MSCSGAGAPHGAIQTVNLPARTPAGKLRRLWKKQKADYQAYLRELEKRESVRTTMPTIMVTDLWAPNVL